MPDPRSFFEDHAPRHLGGNILGALPEGVVVVFHISGPKGGAWQVDTRPGQASIGPVTDCPRDCQVWCSEEDFMGILTGSLNGRRAFLAGRLRVQGDVGLALRLQGLLAKAA